MKGSRPPPGPARPLDRRTLRSGNGIPRDVPRGAPEGAASEVRTAWRPRLGAIPHADGTRFRVWASDARTVEVEIDGDDGVPRRAPLAALGDGLFETTIATARPGDRYAYFLDGQGPFPDPASRFQPDGPDGASEIVDPEHFAWTDHGWRGVCLEDLVLYELHVGTFTPEGTFAAAAEHLAYLRDLGVSAVELMPIAEFPGARNWGYDPAALFAVSHVYGGPDGLCAFVDAAHHVGLGVVVDVVYNHFGPAGAYAPVFSRHVLTDRHRSAWGDGVNLDGEGSRHTRDFLIENAQMWLHEYHLDGLRLDATHALADDGPRHFLTELAARARAGIQGRTVLLIAEDDRNLAHLVQPEAEGGMGLDAVWADDFHHQMRRLLAGDGDGYFGDFSGTVRDVATTLRQGWFYTGQHSRHCGERRGTDPGALGPRQAIICLQNHDQVGNRAMGDRLTDVVDLAAYRAASVLLVCAPETPLLFMGQEWAARTPFRYFTDHEPSLGAAVTEGRRREFAAFAAFATPAARSRIPDPQALATFRSSRLSWREARHEPHAGVLRLYKCLLALRRILPALRDARREGFAVQAIDDATIALRRDAQDGEVLLAIVRLAGAGSCVVPPALVDGVPRWSVVLTTEEARFAADPTPPRLRSGPLRIDFTRPSAIILVPA
ncbi:MAG TPA: malto-oligosyltrehalose trehalohydrolase [Candidatus Binatia bacterium]